MNPPFDPNRKFIRVIEQRANGMVEFEFAVGEPELFVEMLLPQAAFADFCAAQGVAPSITAPADKAGATGAPDTVAEQARQDMAWTLHDAMAWSSRHRL
ncbi:MAG: hypothetical protein RLY71_130 [Pseudomonadota bacterium]